MRRICRPSALFAGFIVGVCAGVCVGGCGGGGSSAAPADDAGSESASDGAPMGCAPGEATSDDGHCEPAGIPPASCGAGFASDGNRGCDAILPSDPCPAGQMAVPGESACHEVSPCADGNWGDIPIEASTQFVDASYAGTAPSDGSMTAPWTTIHQGVAAAASGAIVAIAAGSYVESVLVHGKPVRLWGKCPASVEIVGTVVAGGAVDIRDGAAGTEVHAVAIRGKGVGVLLSGSKDVLVDHVWIHDTANRGINVQVDLGPTDVHVTSSLVEGAYDIGVGVFGSEVTIDASVVRDTRPQSDGTSGRGIEAFTEKGARATLNLQSSVVSGNHEDGIEVSGSDATITSSVVSDTAPRTSDGHVGIGIYVLDDGTQRASLSLQTSTVERNHIFPDTMPAGDAVPSPPETFQNATRQFQRQLLQDALEESGWNIMQAARRLDLTRTHVYNLIRAFGLRRAGS